MLQLDGLVKNPSPSPDLPDLPDEDTYGVPVVSGEMDFFRPILCQAGHTLGLEGLLGVKGDGRGEGVEVLREENIQVVFFQDFFYVFIPFLVSNDTMLVFGRE